ncbi:MAG TPA: hypothetical protein VKZ66_10355 [Pusillimonas sp.]|uniref:hypothetical protein n=1 Tax=unclassified Pusillimonas TaxID=2640016 RepID=UPI0026187DC1|nr:MULTISPECIES: hypothetical protein [unclassified Pusillimonas]HLU20347.1 hypothetical protein [Pusillimonas sp.]
MSATNKTLAPYRTWKVKPYTLSPEARLVQQRAEQAQPPMISLHTSKNSDRRAKKEDTIAT